MSPENNPGQCCVSRRRWSTAWTGPPSGRRRCPARGRVGERTHGHVVDARGGNGSGVRQSQTAGRFQGGRPRLIRTASAISAGVKLSNSTRSAPACRHSSNCASESTSTSTGTSGKASRTARKASAALTGGNYVIVLDQCRIGQEQPMVDPAAATHRTYFSSSRSPGGLTGVADLGRSVAEASRPRGCRGGRPRRVTEQVPAPCARPSAGKPSDRPPIAAPPRAVPDCRRS